MAVNHIVSKYSQEYGAASVSDARTVDYNPRITYAAVLAARHSPGTSVQDTRNTSKGL